MSTRSDRTVALSSPLSSPLSQLAFLALLACPALPLAAGEIHQAVRDGELERVRTLLAQDPELRQATDDSRRTPLHWAALEEGTDLLEATFEASVLEARDFLGLTPLHLTALGKAEAARWLLDRGAPVDAPSRLERATPLHWAAEDQNLEVMRTLLEAGADPDAQSVAGSTPLLSAVRLETERTAEAVAILLEAGGDADAADRGGVTPLMKVAAGGDAVVVETLLDHGAQADRRSAIGDTALQLAAQRGHTEIVRLLLEAGADPESTNGSGRSARDAAAAAGHDEIVKLLDGGS